MTGSEKQPDTLESLTERFNKAVKNLLGIGDAKRSEEKENIDSPEADLQTLKTSRSDEALIKAANSVTLFESYVRSRIFMGTDSLTQLPNRAAFNEQVRTALKKNGTPISTSNGKRHTGDEERRNREEGSHGNSQNYFALIFLDLDRFKGLNDDYGHEAGDVGLQTYANILNSIVRKDNQRFFEGKSRVARLGGDEFSIVLNTKAGDHEEAKENFKKALRRIRKELAVCSFEHNGKTFPLVSSCGVHVFEESDNPKTAMRKADEALYEHKTGLDENGRSKIERYEYAVQELKKQNLPNLQVIEDKRASEKEQLTIEKIGRAVTNLKKAGDVTVFASKNSAPNAVESLREEGITVIMGTAADDYIPNQGREPS